jgi:hypothetical protein
MVSVEAKACFIPEERGSDFQITIQRGPLEPGLCQRLAKLRVEGHGFPYSEELIKKEAKEIEKVFKSGRGVLFLALKEEEIIGYLRLSTLIFGVYATNDIVVSPELHQEGIAQRLWREVAGELNPKIIIGGTKNPAAVFARAKALGGFGYRTFFGNSEVTPSSPKPHSRQQRGLVEACLILRGIPKASDDLILVETDRLLFNVPSISGFPDYIREPFKNLIEAQQKYEERSTVAKILLSVKKGFLGF